MPDGMWLQDNILNFGRGGQQGDVTTEMAGRAQERVSEWLAR